MKEDNVDPAKAGSLAQQIVELLSAADSETRKRAVQAAMMLLGESVAVEQPSGDDNGSSFGRLDDHTGLAQFVTRADNLKPSDNALLCASYHYSVYGQAAFTLTELRNIAKEAGLVIPDRLDMTLSSASKKGKKLFQTAGRAAFRPTATAGIYFWEQWQVKPGKTAKAKSVEE